MRATFLVVSIVLASLLLAIQPPAAEAQSAVTINMTTVGGGGQLSTGVPFAVEFLSLAVTTPSNPVALQKGKLLLDGVREKCTAISLVTDCSAATLTCADGPHDVVAGGAGTGSIDGSPVAEGFIRMHCFSH